MVDLTVLLMWAYPVLVLEWLRVSTYTVKFLNNGVDWLALFLELIHLNFIIIFYDLEPYPQDIWREIRTIGTPIWAERGLNLIKETVVGEQPRYCWWVRSIRDLWITETYKGPRTPSYTGAIEHNPTWWYHRERERHFHYIHAHHTSYLIGINYRLLPRPNHRSDYQGQVGSVSSEAIQSTCPREVGLS